MKIAIMQPYFFPYIGYWQLINAVDTFVVYDDVNFIKGGWINRNYILLNGQKHLITLSLQKVSQHKKINEMTLIKDDKERKKVLITIEQVYKKAPKFGEAFTYLAQFFLSYEKASNEEINLVDFLYDSIKAICSYLDIKTKILKSSDITKNNALHGQEKIIEIVKQMNAKHYINPIGGQELYSDAVFKKENLKLNFLQTKNLEYKQFKHKFIPFLSIIDIMMFNSSSQIRGMLNEYELI